MLVGVREDVRVLELLFVEVGVIVFVVVAERVQNFAISLRSLETRLQRASEIRRTLPKERSDGKDHTRAYQEEEFLWR